MCIAWLDESQVLAMRAALTELMAEFDFASCVLFGRSVPLEKASQGRTGVQFRAAAYEAPSAEVLRRLHQLLQLDGSEALRYDDARRQCSRAMAIVQQGAEPVLNAFLLCGDASAGQWLAPVLRDEQSTKSFGRMLLSSGSKPPAAMAARSPQVCACMNVDEASITAQLGRCSGSPDELLTQLKSSLGCGTRCGSCIPTIKQLVQAVPPVTLMVAA